MILNNPDYDKLVKKFDAFLFKRDKGQVFESLMDFCIFNFCLNDKVSSWPYNEEETKAIAEMFSLWVLAARTEIERNEWADIPGNLHQNCIYSKTGRGFLGQFFTPEHISNLMATIAYSGKEAGTDKVETVNDPACGSGRLLLASHTCLQKEKRRDYCVAQDLDPVCVKMTVANFLLHGVEGEVICGNSLLPDEKRFIFHVNEHLNDPTSDLFGVPHCRVEYPENNQKQES